MLGRSYIDKLAGEKIVYCRIIEPREQKAPEFMLKCISSAGYQFLYLKTETGLEFFLGGGQSWENTPKIREQKGSVDSLNGKTIQEVEFILNNDVLFIDRVPLIKTHPEYEYFDDDYNDCSYLKILCTDRTVYECMFYQFGCDSPESSEAAWRLFDDNEMIDHSDNLYKEVSYD